MLGQAFTDKLVLFEEHNCGFALLVPMKIYNAIKTEI